ncbi:MAG TPA: glutathione S-transferase [Methylibium sp.]|nr:glutathione S-transferase [Methylibium sp.]
MVTLCGFALSNYYNKVKMVLLEKGIAFEERFVKPGRDVGPAASPMGKIPYLETPEGTLCESQAIVEWLEAAYPERHLLPPDPWAAAKLRELGAVMELHVELVARQLYAQAFFNTPLPEKFTERVRPQLVKGLAAFAGLARFAPHVGGEDFTLVDCAAYVHLPLVALASQAVYGVDLVAEAGIDWKTYVRVIEQRPSAQKVAADRRANTAPLKSV